jgi:hypothetical protein
MRRYFRPAALLPYPDISGFRPVALRPILSNGLLFSGLKLNCKELLAFFMICLDLIGYERKENAI